MSQHLALVTLVVADYDEAIDYFTEKLNFHLREDTKLDDNKRWVVVSPPGNMTGTNLLLAKASNDKQIRAVGNQTGGRVFLFLHTDNFWEDYERMKNQGVDFVEEPRSEVYGTVVVFRDLYGNKWDLVEKS